MIKGKATKVTLLYEYENQYFAILVLKTTIILDDSLKENVSKQDINIFTYKICIY